MKRLFALFFAVAVVLLIGGCSGNEEKNVSLPKVMSDIKQKITNTQMMDLAESDLMPNYGISSNDVKQFSVYTDSTGAKGDEIILMQGKDSQAVLRIKEKLESRYRQKETEMKDYLPQEYAMLKKCRVRQDGSYVSLIVSPQQDELQKIYLSEIGVS